MKIVMKKVVLINWYGFSKVVIPYDDYATLLTGENESGKSTVLDAIRYAYIGDTVFNRSSGSSKRTIKSYTRCLTDPSSNKYARPADLYPVINTHIGLEFEDALNKRSFTLVTTIETNASDDTNPLRYIINLPIENIEFTEVTDGIERSRSAKEMSEIYSVPTYNTSDGVKMFMREIGLNLNDASINDYKIKLRNMMTYKAETRISTFMKNSVLEPKPVDLEKLKRAKINIDNINEDLQRIKDEQDKLREILKSFNEYNRLEYNITLNKLEEYFLKKRRLESRIKEEQTNIDKIEIELKDIKENQLPVADRNFNDALVALTQANANLKESKGEKALEEKEEYRDELLEDRDKYQAEAERLSLFQETVNSIINKNLVELQDKELLTGLADGDYSETEKKYAVEQLKESLENKRDEISKNIGVLENRIKELENRNREIQESISNLGKNRVDINRHSAQNTLINKIKEALTKANNKSDVKMAYEYVIDIDEQWQDAVETFIGPHRFAILVDPDGFDIANSVYDNNRIKGVELVRTNALDEREFEVYSDSVVNKLDIKNPLAKKFFDFWLGKIHAVENNQVHEYDSAMSYEGKLSRNMAVSYLDVDRLNEYVLGIGAAEKTIKKLLDEKQSNNNEKETLISARIDRSKAVEEIRTYLKAFGKYDYSAQNNLKVTEKLLKEALADIEDLKRSLENDNVWFTLNQIVNSCQINFDACKNARDELAKHENRLKNAKDNAKNTQATIKNEIEELNNSLGNTQIDFPRQYEKAYDDANAMSEEELSENIWAYETSSRNDRRYRELIGIIQAQQSKYNDIKKQEERLDIGVDYEQQYHQRLDRITIDDFDTVQRKMQRQTAEYEQIFKNDFCNTIYGYTKSSIADVRKINTELRKLKFQTEYRIEISQLNDGSDFSKIIKYAKYIESTLNLFAADNDLSQDQVDKLEEEIREIINRITSPEGQAYIDDYADYRNYLSYAVKINNASTVEGDLASQIGYDSGAATQIPYILILAAALSMYYNARTNSARLIFIDEPFEKMSPSNIEQMLKFFRKQEFQTILCAPIDKMGSIGDECGVLDYIVKLKKEQMVVGNVIYKDVISEEGVSYE